MNVTSKTVKSAAFFAIIGIAVGVGLLLLMGNDQTLRGIFQPLAGGNSGNNQADNILPFATRENYQARLAVGEEGAFHGLASGGKEPYRFEWKFSDGVTLIGQNVTRSFSLPGTYHIEVTVSDADGKQVKNSNLIFDVLQQLPKENGSANATSIIQQHN